MRRFAFAMLALVITAPLVNSHNLFVNASLAGYYLYIIAIAGFVATCAIWLLKQPSYVTRYLSWPLVLYGAFTAYNIVNSLLHGALAIKATYTLIALVFVFVLPVFVYRIKSKITWVWYGITLLAVIESFVCVLQWLGVLPSVNGYFAVTGTCPNPNVTAMFMAMCVPAAWQALFNQKGRLRTWLIVCMLLLLTGLLLLQCRTAMIGASVATFIMLQRRYRLWQQLVRFSRFKRLLLQGAGIIVLALAVTQLYHSKKDSADSRILVWKLSLQMVKEKPLAGYGYGSFEKNYNLYQAQHFAHDIDSLQPPLNTGYVYMAYNELLETAVEGGIPAFLLLLSLIVCLLLFPLLKQNNAPADVALDWPGQGRDVYGVAYAGVTAYISMSLVNFTFQAIPVYTLFVVYLTILSTHPVYAIRTSFPFKKWKFYGAKITGTAFILLSCFLFIHFSREARAHIKVKQAVDMAKAGSVHEALAGLEPLKPVLQNAESFWRNYAYVQLAAHQFKQAEEALIKAGTLSSGPDIHYALGYCYEQSGAWGLAQKEYRLAICLEPQRLKPRYALMKLSFRTGDTAQMICMARQIMALPLKGNMQEARRYKQEAGKALRLKALTSSVKPL